MYIFLIYQWYNDVKKIVKVYTGEQKTKKNPQGFQIQQDQVQSNCLVSNCDHIQLQRLNIPSRAEANSLNLVAGCLREPARWSHYLLIIPESYTDSTSTSNLQYVCAQVCVEGCGTCTWLFCRLCGWVSPHSEVRKLLHCLARREASGVRPHLQSGNRLEAYQVWILQTSGPSVCSPPTSLISFTAGH